MNKEKETLRNKLLMAEVEMNHCTRFVYNTNTPCPEYIRRARKYQELFLEWKRKYGEEPYKNRKYYIAHLTDEFGWSAGYSLCKNEEEAKKEVDDCNNTAHWSCQGYSYYEEW